MIEKRSNNGNVRMAEGYAPLGLVMYFVLNPEAKLTGAQIRERFAVPKQKSIKEKFENAILNGLVRVEPGERQNSTNTYAAGEALLKMRAKFTEAA